MPTERSLRADRGAESAAEAGRPDRGPPGGRQPPLAGYALVLAGFGAALGGVAELERRLGRPVERPSALELGLLAGATFKAARVISRERLGGVVRAPFVEGDEASPYAEPAGDGLRRALGELVTCSRCTGTWVALGLVTARTVAPRPAAVLVTTLAAGAANDFLQAAFAALCARADERRA